VAGKASDLLPTLRQDEFRDITHEFRRLAMYSTPFLWNKLYTKSVDAGSEIWFNVPTVATQ